MTLILWEIMQCDNYTDKHTQRGERDRERGRDHTENTLRKYDRNGICFSHCSSCAPTCCTSNCEAGKGSVLGNNYKCFISNNLRTKYGPTATKININLFRGTCILSIYFHQITECTISPMTNTSQTIVYYNTFVQNGHIKMIMRENKKMHGDRKCNYHYRNTHSNIGFKYVVIIGQLLTA